MILFISQRVSEHSRLSQSGGKGNRIKVDEATNPERRKIDKKENKSNQINFDQHYNQSILQYLQMMTQLGDEGFNRVIREKKCFCAKSGTTTKK